MEQEEHREQPFVAWAPSVPFAFLQGEQREHF